MFAFVKGRVGDLFEEFGVVPQVANVTPVDFIGVSVEVVIAECL